MAELGGRGERRLNEARSRARLQPAGPDGHQGHENGSDSRAANGGESGSDLPHHLVTDGNLSFFLSRAGAASDAIIGRGAPAGPPVTTANTVDQASVNDAVVNSLHQLDHRSLGHRDRLEQLESSLLDIVRRLDRLEAMAESQAADNRDIQPPALTGTAADVASNGVPPSR
jgi:hypothetical protein